jgi:ribosomal protein S18 acetylase RimI-like enzyme
MSPPPPAFRIRLATAADAEPTERLAASLAELPLLQRYGATPGGLAAELGQLVRDPAARSAGHKLLLAEPVSAAGEPVGLARVVVGGQPAGHGFGQFGRGGYLQLIALRSGFAGRGLGQLLLAAVEELVALDSRDLFLLTSDFNHGAQRFYARAGYLRVGELPDFVRPGIAEIIYWKRLRSAR